MKKLQDIKLAISSLKGKQLTDADIAALHNHIDEAHNTGRKELIIDITQVLPRDPRFPNRHRGQPNAGSYRIKIIELFQELSPEDFA